MQGEETKTEVENIDYILTAKEATKLTEDNLENDVYMTALDKAVQEVCKWIRTAAKAGYSTCQLELKGLEQLPEYVDHRAKLVGFDEVLLEDLQDRILLLGFELEMNDEFLIISWGEND